MPLPPERMKERLSVSYVAAVAAKAGVACRLAWHASAEVLILCDTNGGTLPMDITSVVAAVRAALGTEVPLGIHAHNDSELAVANTLMAVRGGVTHIQGALNGYGERCGNANLCSVIPNLQLKMGYDCISTEQLRNLTKVARSVSGTANLAPDTHQPYTGTAAFTHKGGIHVSAMMKVERSYQHINPQVVGNEKHFTVSELSGKNSILQKVQELGLELSMTTEQAREVVTQIKELESRGYCFEGADASVELLIRRIKPDYQPPFELVDSCTLVEQCAVEVSEATVKIKVGAQVFHASAGGKGPLNALESALRKVLEPIYPHLQRMYLTDYKVRIVNHYGTESRTQVLIDSANETRQWRAVGSSSNFAEAICLALVDSIEFALLNDNSSKRDDDAVI